MREGAYYKATDPLKRAIELDDKYALAHARLAEAWTEMDFLDRAKDEMLTATGLVPDLSALPKDEALYFDAVRSTVGRKYPEAVKAYEEIARLNPNRPQVYVDLGRAYDKNNETEKAVKAFTDATTHDPSYAAAFISLGTLQARQKSLAAATEAFARAEQLYTSAGNGEGEAEVHYQRGYLYVSLGKSAEAHSELQRSLDIARETKNQYQQVQALLQLPYTETTNAEQAQAFAREGMEIAESAGMPNLAALGHIRLATLLLQQGDYAGTEQQLNRALDFARDYKVRRLEALALFHFGSMYSKQGRQDDAVRFIGQARDFYLQGNYRKEADQAQMLVGRLKRQQGDYAGALQTFDELLLRTKPSGDRSQLCDIQREYGVVLLMQERYPEALEHLREAVAAARALHDPLLISYALYNQAKALWPLARYVETDAALKEVADIAAQPASPNRGLLADTYSTEAFVLLSQRHFPDAKAKGKQTLALAQSLGPASKNTAFTADLVMCLAVTYSGDPAHGRAACDDASRVAAALKDPSLIADAQMTLAEAALEGDDFQAARVAALEAEKFFARSERVESDWRALAVAGIACRRAGDETAARDYLARAGALLSRLEQSLGPDAPGYLSRLDVQRLRGELDDRAAVAAVR